MDVESVKDEKISRRMIYSFTVHEKNLCKFSSFFQVMKENLFPKGFIYHPKEHKLLIMRLFAFKKR